MQPVVGAYADKSTSRYGRRGPYMVYGAIVTGAGLLLLGWTSEAVSFFVPEGDTRKSATILVAVLCIYALDFSINAVQACSRSLIVDTLPIQQQQAGSAWASRLVAAGHLASYSIGTFNLVKIFPPWLGGDTQFKKMTVIATLALFLTIGITCWATTERVRLPSEEDSTLSKRGPYQPLEEDNKSSSTNTVYMLGAILELGRVVCHSSELMRWWTLMVSRQVSIPFLFEYFCWRDLCEFYWSPKIVPVLTTFNVIAL